MDPICLSAATVLRCSSLTRGQNIAFVVPVVVEFLASCLVISLRWGSGKQHLWLVAEGWAYFILALLDLISAIPSLSIDNVSRFRSFDIGIGITSFFPLFFYTLFLYLFTRKKLFLNLPRYVVNAATVFMLLSLPVIIAMNEVASVTVRTISFDTGNNPSFAFSKKRGEWLWQFLTALTLAVLTAYQVTVFSLSVFRLLWIRVHQQRGKHDIRIGGIGWIIAGVQLGALEAIIGFVGGRFEVVMTRRVMRLIGRSCLYIGIILGVDQVKKISPLPYDNLQRPKKLHRSPQHLKISNPRFSTFQHLSPMAAGFHSGLRAPGALQTSSNTTEGLKSPHYLTFTQRQGQMQLQRERVDLRGLSPFASLMSSADQRVTVLYDVEGGPPLLQMRFSALDVPLSAVCPVTPEQGKGVNPSQKLRFAEPIRRGSSTPPDVGGVRPLPSAPISQGGVKSRTPGGSLSSITPSIVEIVDAPRRTISQRRAEARVFHARGDQAEKQDAQDTRTFYSETSDSEDLATSPQSRPYRPPTPGPRVSVSRFSEQGGVHRRTDTQSISLKSVSDSIQAVQELASQFPALPPSVSLEHSPNFTRPSPPGTNDSPNSNTGPFVLAIGSPTDLGPHRRLPSSPSSSVAQVSQGEVGHQDVLDSPYPSSRGSGQIHEEDIAWASGVHTPSSAHTGFSNATIRQSTAPPDAVSPLTAQQARFQSHVGFDNSSASKTASEVEPISEWVDDPLNERVVHKRILPQNVGNRGEIVANTSLSGMKRVNPQMKPIVIPRKRSNLPKVIQGWDDSSVMSKER